MDDSTNRYPFGSGRPSLSQRTTTSDDLMDESAEAVEQAPAQSSGRSRKSVSTTSQFVGAAVPVQFKLPKDLVDSLKLHSINNSETMSDIVLRCLTTTDVIEKAWISTRKAS